MNIICAKPRVSAYNFMRFLFATLVKNRTVIVDLDSIVNKIYSFKQGVKSDLLFLFEDIEFRENIDSVVSYDISEGINCLQTFGVIGKLNPTYEKVVIYLTDTDADDILAECEPIVEEAISNLANTF